MMVHSSKSLVVGGIVVAVMAGACSRTAQFTVTRPAMVNASAVGNTMQVGAIDPQGHMQAAAVIVADLQNRIANSLNRSIRLVAQGGGIIITAAVLNDDYGETIDRTDGTCTRQVPNGTNAQGQTQYRTESYTCTTVRRIGTGYSNLAFTLTNGTNGQVILAQNFENRNQVVTTGMYSPYERRDPDRIDAQGLVSSLRAGNVERFARVILPWNETVNVDFEDCDGDNRCRDGFEQARTGTVPGLTAAEALFTQVIANYQSAAVPVPPNEAEKIGEAFYNRALAREYLGHYAQAAADLNRAIQLRPNETDWPNELTNIQQFATAQEHLREQGAISNDTQNVQSAGHP